MGKGGKSPDLKEAFVGDTRRSGADGPAVSCKKVLCLFAQFAPYFLMWYGFFLIVNDIIRSNCEDTFKGCTLERTGETGQEAKEQHDMFTCPTISASGESGIVLVIGGVFTALVMMTQFLLLVIKTGPSPFGSLRLVVWMEVAKEQGSIFNMCTIAAAAVIFAATIISLVDFITKFDDNVNDLLDLVFQALTSLWTAYLLTTYNSPVTTLFHAKQCPDLDIAYAWWQPSEDVVASIHLLLALDAPTAHSLIREGGGDPDAMGKLLDERNLGHNDGDLIASLGAGDEGVHNLELMRDFFSHPPTRTEVKAEKDKGGGGLLAGASDSDPGVRQREIPERGDAGDSAEVASLRERLAKSEEDVSYLRELLKTMQQSQPRSPPRSPAATPPPKEDESMRQVIAEHLDAVASQLLHEPAATQAVNNILATYSSNSDLAALTIQPQRLEQEILSYAEGPASKLESVRERETRRAPRGQKGARAGSVSMWRDPVFGGSEAGNESADFSPTAAFAPRDSPSARPVPPPRVGSRTAAGLRGGQGIPPEPVFGDNTLQYSSSGYGRSPLHPRPLSTPALQR